MLDTWKYNLKHNRKSVVKALTAWFLFGAIILVFVFWGIGAKNQPGMQSGSVAVINGEQISAADMSEAVDRMRRDPRFQQFASLGGDFGTKFLEQQALAQLIEMKLINQETEKERIWTPDAEVRDTIVAIPAFQEDGRFKSELYRNYLAMIHKTPAEFENEIRSEKAVGRTVELFRSALQPIPEELEKQKVLKDMKANLEYVAIPSQNLVSKDKIPQSDVDKFLGDKANEQALKNYYDSHKDKFSTPEMVHARHILISTEGADETADAKARDLANKIAERAKKEDFAKLAKEFSNDPGSKAKGGDLGFFPRGQMVPEFDKVAFESPVGKVSEPVKSQFGYHVIEVLEKKPAQSRTLEAAKSDIARMILAEQRSHDALEAAEKIVQSGDANALNQFVAQHGLKWQETGTFSVDAETIPQIGAGGEAVKTAFQLSPQNPVAKSLIRKGSTAYAVRYKAPGAEAKKSATPDASPEMLAAMTANRRSEDAVRLWVDGLRKSAKVSTDDRFASGGGGSEPVSEE